MIFGIQQGKEEFVNAEVTDMLDELEKLTTQMDVPEFRRRKVAWLSRNLVIRNSNHPNYEEAMTLIKSLIKQGVR